MLDPTRAFTHSLASPLPSPYHPNNRWNWHEVEEGTITGLTGPGGVTEFLDVAKSVGMLVILRPGPYICGEWEMGGLPAWLLTYPDIKLRTYDTQYVSLQVVLLSTVYIYFGHTGNISFFSSDTPGILPR